MQDSIFLSLGAWTWMIAGLALMAFELIAPGTVFLWFGLAALVTGAAALTWVLSWQAQIGLFAMLSCLSLAIWFVVKRRMVPPSGDPSLNLRAGRHVGRRFVLTEPIVAGAGRVRIDDTVWRIEGEDCPAGTEVVVSGVDGAVLQVQRPQ